MVSSTMFGDVAQLGERDNRTVEVRGSSPLISTMYYTIEETKAHLGLKCGIVYVLIIENQQRAGVVGHFHAESSRVVQGYKQPGRTRL